MMKTLTEMGFVLGIKKKKKIHSSERVAISQQLLDNLNLGM